MATASKSRSRKAIQAVVTVTKFTDTSRPFSVLRDQPLKEFSPVTFDDYRPRGSDTPLRDATARFIAHLDSLQAPDRVVIGLMADESGSMTGKGDAVIAGINQFVAGMADVEKIDPKTAGTVLAVIATDGFENASREISSQSLTQIVAERETKGYTFIFLGANIDAWGQGRSLGFSGGVRGQTVSYENTAKGTAAVMDSITSDSVNYLANQGEYVMARSGSSMRSVMSDGTETLSNINAPGTTPDPAVHGLWTSGTNPESTTSAYGDVAEALKTARKATS